jgi:raffinose/stachyose/melibiose transport system permease protein
MKRVRPWLYLLPCVGVLVVFAYGPLIEGLQLALYQTDGHGLRRFVGLGNFQELLGDELFWHSFGVLLVFFLVLLPLQVICPLIAAKLIAGLRSSRAAYFYRVVLVLPMIVPLIVTIMIWRNFYMSDGVLNRFLATVGLEAWQRSWLGDSTTVIGALIFMAMPWAGGPNLLIYLAGFLNIPQELREAMEIDGASPLRRFWSLDIPLIRPQVQIVAILGIIMLLQAYENILILTNGGPGSASLVPALYLFRNGFEYGRLGYAAAIGCVLFALSLVFTLINMRLLRSDAGVRER